MEGKQQSSKICTDVKNETMGRARRNRKKKKKKSRKKYFIVCSVEGTILHSTVTGENIA
jgi:hypothetical protein